jgi:A/G-specific adenine glycosylase
MNFSKVLILWYINNKRDLPWRQSKNPYYIWLSEIILQQTRVDQGLSYYNSFVNTYPTVQLLAKANEMEVLKLWQGLGYYSRARNLHFSAKYIVNELGGKFPSNYHDLLKLKGVGDYTAAAIASMCYNEAKAVVDGNVFRVLSRYFAVDTPINSVKGKKQFTALAQSLIDCENPGTFNQAVMELGALICTPKNANCTECPLNSSCKSLMQHTVYNFPVKEKKLTVKQRFFNYLVVETNSGKTAIQQRKQGIWQNLFEFPLIETQDEIDEKQLIEQKLFQDLFKNKSVNFKLFNQNSIVHKLTHQHIYAKFWIVKVNTINIATIKWNSIEKFPFPILIVKFLKSYYTK